MAKPTTRTRKPARAAAEAEAPKTKLDPQSGQEGVIEPVKPAQAHRKAAVKQQFDEADRRGEPDQAAIDEATMSRSIRGW